MRVKIRRLNPNKGNILNGKEKGNRKKIKAYKGCLGIQ